MATNDCDRCDGEGTIHGETGDLACPNCEGVCQWCNTEFDDGEELGDTGLHVCRPCIRDMAGYKEDVVFQLFVDSGLDDYLDDADAFREDIDDALVEVFDKHGVTIEQGDWGLRNRTEGGE